MNYYKGYHTITNKNNHQKNDIDVKKSGQQIPIIGLRI